MAHYNIVHTEDEPSTVRFVEAAARRQGLTYRNADSLSALESLLPDNSADVWIVDGKFAVKKGD